MKNTYPPPSNWIWACRAIQPFYFEPTRDLLKGVIIGTDVGEAQRCSQGAIFLLFFIMSFSIQVSVAERSRDRMGQNKIHIILITHVFQMVAGGHGQPLFSSAKLRTRSYRQETERND